MKPNEIRELREYLKKTKNDFGGVFGVSGTQVLRWERGDSKPPKQKMYLLEKLNWLKNNIKNLSHQEAFDGIREISEGNLNSDVWKMFPAPLANIVAEHEGVYTKDNFEKRLLEASRELTPNEIEQVIEIITIIKKRRDRK